MIILLACILLPKESKRLFVWGLQMSVSIDRIIQSAKKSAKFGNLQAARMTCHEGLENYPNNPRLKNWQAAIKTAKFFTTG